MLDDIQQVCILDILDEGVLDRTSTKDSVGTPLLNLPDDQMLCGYHSAKIEKNAEIEKCGN